MKANDKVDELDQLLILAKKSELAVLVKLYAEKNPLFRKEVTRYLDAKYKSAATTSNYRKLMKEAFKQTIVSGTYYTRPHGLLSKEYLKKQTGLQYASRPMNCLKRDRNYWLWAMRPQPPA